MARLCQVSGLLFWAACYSVIFVLSIPEQLKKNFSYKPKEPPSSQNSHWLFIFLSKLVLRRLLTKKSGKNWDSILQVLKYRKYTNLVYCFWRWQTGVLCFTAAFSTSFQNSSSVSDFFCDKRDVFKLSWLSGNFFLIFFFSHQVFWFFRQFWSILVFCIKWKLSLWTGLQVFLEGQHLFKVRKSSIKKLRPSLHKQQFLAAFHLSWFNFFNKSDAFWIRLSLVLP